MVLLYIRVLGVGRYGRFMHGEICIGACVSFGRRRLETDAMRVFLPAWVFGCPRLRIPFDVCRTRLNLFVAGHSAVDIHH